MASQAYDQAEEQASVISTEALADLLLGMMADLHHQTRALSALMEGDAQAGNRLVQTRAWAVGRIERVLLARCPKAGGRVKLEDIAILLLNGMKLMTVEGTAPSSAGAVEELRAMFRFYLSERLNREGTVSLG